MTFRRRAAWLAGLVIALGCGLAVVSAASAVADSAESAGAAGSSHRKPAAARSAEPRTLHPSSAGVPASAALRERSGRRPTPPADRQTRVTVLKGTNLGLPPAVAPFVRRVTGNATFTADSVYDLKSVDQFDWNKLTGIGFSIPANINSIQVGWRYNLASQLFEVAPVFNVDDTRVLPSPAEVISVPIGERFFFDVDYQGITLTYGEARVFKATPVDLVTSWFSFRTWTWFGGTSPAPRTLSLLIRAG